MTSIVEVEGIGASYAAKLADAGIKTTDALLEAGGSPKGRKDLAAKTGISDAQILRWVNHVDLFRIKGVAGENSELLEAAGVDTVAELATRNPASLHAKLVETNTKKKLVRQVPGEGQVEDWISQAKKLPRAVSY
jgi:predicted flap endonuclease-1-like 5' DNA nuclease